MPKESTLPRPKISQEEKELRKKDKEMLHLLRAERTPEDLEAREAWRKACRSQASKGRREFLNSMSPEELSEYKANRAYDKEVKAREKENKAHCKREITLLKFMLKSGTYNYHHGQRDLLNKDIEKAIARVKERNNPKQYHPYVWNYYGEGNSYMSTALLERLWSHDEFKSIYDVPLDGSYYFYCYDSGQRGLGAFDYMTAARIGEGPAVPFVNPGGFPQITV